MKHDTTKIPRRAVRKDAQSEAYIKQAKSRKAESSNFLRAVTIFVIIILGLVISIFILADNKEFLEVHFGKDSIVTKLFLKLSTDNDNKERAEFSLPFGPRRQNILLLGVDSNGEGADLWEGTRTDTIILMNVDPRTKSVNALSIPRDSKVYLPDNHGIQKINAAHAIGGIGMTIKTIEDTLGVKVDRYIMVHDDAVKEIVNALGGVDIYVEKNMHYNDFSGKLFINLTKGEHHLDGKEIVGYLRFRHDPMGDIGRTQRQQWFLRGLMKELQKPETIAKLPEIITVANKYIKTNMSFYELSQYAGLAKHLDMNKIEIAMLPGSPNKKGYISYWILDPDKTQEVVNRVIYREKTDPSSIVDVNAGIMYSTSKSVEAETVIAELKEAGINVSCTGTVNKTHSQFVAHSKDISNDYYNWLKKKTPSIDDFQFVYEPVNYFCGDTDFTIIIAGK